MAYLTYRVEITRDESRSSGTASIEITAYIDRVPETNEPEFGRLSRAGMEQSAPIHRRFRVVVRGVGGRRTPWRREGASNPWSPRKIGGALETPLFASAALPV